MAYDVDLLRQYAFKVNNKIVTGTIFKFLFPTFQSSTQMLKVKNIDT